MASAPAEPIWIIALRWVLALVMIGVGVLHFAAPEPFLAIMPAYLPWHRELVLLSGGFEILGGVGLLIPQTRRLAGWGLIALYVCVFPANLWQATQGVDIPGLEGPAWVRWARLPLQLLFISWAWAVSRPRAPDRARPPRAT